MKVDDLVGGVAGGGGGDEVAVWSGDHTGDGAEGGVFDDPAGFVAVVAVVVEFAGGVDPTAVDQCFGGGGTESLVGVQGPVLAVAVLGLRGDEVVGVEGVGQSAGTVVPAERARTCSRGR